MHGDQVQSSSISNSGYMINFVCTPPPTLKNHVNGCHENHAFLSANELSLMTKIFFFISGVPMNDLAPMKNVLGCKLGQISSRGIALTW